MGHGQNKNFSIKIKGCKNEANSLGHPYINKPKFPNFNNATMELDEGNISEVVKPDRAGVS